MSMNYTVTITLGAGDKGKQWDSLLRQAAKKDKMSIGMYVRTALREKLSRQMAALSDQPAAAEPVKQ